MAMTKAQKSAAAKKAAATRKRKAGNPKKKTTKKRNPQSRLQDKIIRIGGATLAFKIAAGLIRKLKPFLGMEWIPERYLIPLIVIIMDRFKWITIPDIEVVAMTNMFNAVFHDVGLNDTLSGFGQGDARRMAQYNRSPAQTAAAIREAQRGYTGKATPQKAKTYKGVPKRTPRPALSYGDHGEDNY